MLIRWFPPPVIPCIMYMEDSLGFDHSRSNEIGYVIPLRKNLRVLLKHECSIDLKIGYFFLKRGCFPSTINGIVFSIELGYKTICPFIANANQLTLNKSVTPTWY